MRSTPLFGVLLPSLLLCCSETPSPPPDRGGPPDAGGRDVAADRARDAVAPDAGSPSAVGTACTQGTTLQGSCPAGFLCAPYGPGNYCTQLCAFAPCPADAVCVQSPKSGEYCARRCAASTECRAAQGYVCDGSWRACAMPDTLSPVLKKCPAGAALPRTTFGKVTQLSTAAGPGKYHMEPAAALHGAGDLTAVHMAPAGLLDSFGLGVATLSVGGALSSDRALGSTRKQIFDPWLATDRGGKLHLVYLAHDGMDVNGIIGYATSGDGLKWSTERVIHDPADCGATKVGCLDKPMVAIGPQVSDKNKDAVYLLYFAANGMRLLRSLDGGQTFAPSVAVPAGFYGDAEVTGDGALHVVSVRAGAGGHWLGSTKNWIEYVRSDDGGKSFSAPKTVSSPTEPVPVYFSNAQVAANPTQATIHVVYPVGLPDGAWEIMLATSKDSGASWTRIKVNDDAPCANHMTPTLTLAPTSGKLHVAWLENRGGSGGVAYAACSADGSTCGANQAVSDRPFADYSIVRHSPRWLGEYFGLLVDEPRNALHAVWTQTVSEAGKPVARIFHARGALQ